MKTSNNLAVAALALAMMAIIGFAQVLDTKLTPPGPPQDHVMKTLDVVEARIPISSNTTPGTASATYIISQSGSYYLVENLVGEHSQTGLVVQVSNVTIDLNGFRLFPPVSKIMPLPTSASLVLFGLSLADAGE